jgi:hypothetical protein
MSDRPDRTGSRFLYQPFDSAHARIETHERVLAERWQALERRLQGIEAALERLERRLWMAVYAIASGVVAYAAWGVFGKVA